MTKHVAGEDWLGEVRAAANKIGLEILNSVSVNDKKRSTVCCNGDTANYYRTIVSQGSPWRRLGR